MIRILYHIAIWLLGGVMRIASIYNHKAKLWLDGRKNKPEFPAKTGFTIWMHCASSGEFEQGRPAIESIHSIKKDITFYLSFYSPSGILQWQNYDLARKVFSLPLDTTDNAQTLLSSMQPDLVLFIKNEFWFNHLHEIIKRNIPCLFISSILQNKKYIFWPFFKQIISRVNHFFVQQEMDRSILMNKGIDQVTVVGDTRVDRVLEVAGKPYQSTLIEYSKKDKRYCIIYGSVWVEDMDHIVNFINERSDILHILAPHDISDKNINNISSRLSGDISYFSKNDVSNSNKIIVDTIGQLKYMYRYADIAYIGGGFGEGIHNTLEPAVYQIPIIFGPRYKKFPEAVQFINMQVANCISSQDDFINAFDVLIEGFKEIKGKLDIYFRQNQGATQEIVNYLIKKRYVTN